MPLQIKKQRSSLKKFELLMVLSLIAAIALFLAFLSHRVSTENALNTQSYAATAGGSCSAAITWGQDQTTQIGGTCWRSVSMITCSNGVVYRNKQVPPSMGGCWVKSRWEKEANTLCGCNGAGNELPTQPPIGNQTNRNYDCDVSNCGVTCNNLKLPATAKCSGTNSCYGGGNFKSIAYKCNNDPVLRWKRYSPGGCVSACDLYRGAAAICGC